MKEECQASIFAKADDMVLDGSSGLKSVFRRSFANILFDVI